MYTSELFEGITNRINLSPSAEYELRVILRSLDGEEIIDDLDEEEE